jgi:hypothetical protein
MKNLLSLFLIAFSFEVLAVGRLDFSYGYFAINAKTKDNSSNVSAPYAANLAYLYPFKEKTQLNIGYTVLFTDVSGTDKGYGVNLGVNYFPLHSAKNETLKNEYFEVERNTKWKPYVGLGFYQREFQSIKNSYAGLGLSTGVEHYFDKFMSFKGEIRTIALSGSNDSSASELNAFVGVIVKI